MPFNWYYSTVPEEFQIKLKNRFHEAYIEETRSRARLFLNLGYSQEYATKRIQANLAWEFELSKVPDFYKEIPKIVSEVYINYGSGKEK